ncbi:PucR family transcriptional regulator [Bacillus kwashiorkori]|uniref:PucR family transcriptional regulator n=1 Tax=Bacillus kwashiorkori TaxID=1522318 RepID=UPI0007815374|nr:helix-turn-helix domain-containing protein [Bacillus kwashiorkori]
MINKICEIFSGAEILSKPFIKQKDTLYFLDEKSNQYLAIPKNKITERELTLLSTIFIPVEDAFSSPLNQTVTQKKWHDYLTGNGQLPENDSSRVRFTHFYFDGIWENFLEAVNSYFQESMIIIWLNEQNGVIIEEEAIDCLTKDDFQSFSEAIISDFYFEVYFYVGRFFSVNYHLKNHFHREQQYFHESRPFSRSERIFTFETTFPFYLLTANSKELLNTMKAEWVDIFQYDDELLAMIKLYLENNSNTSLTAKKLYMHRNSLQYRIDKFVESSSIDIKSFNGALCIYFICLFGEFFSNNEHFAQTDEK